MSEEEISVEDLYKAKIAQDFEIFSKKKMKMEQGIEVHIDTGKLSAIEEILENHPIPENEMLAEMYRKHAEVLRQEVHDGNFGSRKKCEHCKRFYQDYENNKGILPCPKMQAYQKMNDLDRENLTDEEYLDARDGQLKCGKLYLPDQKQEETDEELAELERKQLEAIEEWEAIALLGLEYP